MTRPEWLRLLALAAQDDLERAVAALGTVPEHVMLRSPEIGLVMVRGRAGGTGDPFNLGEMTVTRCTLRIDAATGFGCVAGRSARRAELVALCDALLQHETWHARVEQAVLAPLRLAEAERREDLAKRRESTRADFVTVVRSGE
ncbi:MAG TPA: phosphonate C-P lyase system protein PhnG [Candidatus Acidoferrum sp.]|nr:phosphonate C-P lyase system protein PhnG [Candidatus Acidoferrum sp.]